MSAIRAKRPPQQPALRVPAGPEQGQLLDAMEREVRRIGAHAHRSTWGGRVTLVIEPDVARTRTRARRYAAPTRPTSLGVFFAGDELRITGGSDDDDDNEEPVSAEGRPLSGVEELHRRYAALRERMLHDRGEEDRRTKVRKLKERAIETQIAALAGRLRFSYALRIMATKVVLVVRFDEKVALHVDIPFRRAQPVIDQLEKLITVSRDVYVSGGGARFTVTTIYEGGGDRRVVFTSPPAPA